MDRWEDPAPPSAPFVAWAFAHRKVQQEHARRIWGVPYEGARLIVYHADTDFFQPSPNDEVKDGQICSVGSEWRDYKTLLRAIAGMPGITLKMTSYSPWAKRIQDVSGYKLPPNAEIGRYDYVDLRKLYASSMFCVVPMQNADFAAGITAILEGMAMGKPVISTATVGMHPGIIRGGESGLLVPPDDPDALSRAIKRLWENRDLRVRMGLNARHWVEQNATLRHWVDNIAEAIQASCGRHMSVSLKPQ